MPVSQILSQTAPLAPLALRPGRDVLRIALVNNLPDGALHSTERQFCTLLTRASEGLTIKLDLYSLPGISRGQDARAHLAAYYDDLSELERTRPDGIIVTGTEPRERRLQDEAFWPAFTRLFDITQHKATPVIWCCLAAHAAVLYGDGIERMRLPKKLSGVYNSHVVYRAHDLLRGVPRRWRMPQSRLHGLPERALLEHGYEIAARSRLTGPDVFFRRDPACHVFLQSHPEYQASSLAAEYRRDVKRFLRGEQGLPEPPRDVFSSAVMRRLWHFQMEISRKPDLSRLATLDAILAGLAPETTWENATSRFYSNWLTHLSEVARDMPAPSGRHVPICEFAPSRVLVPSKAAE